LPNTALSGKSGGPVTTDAAYATRSTHTTYAAHTANTTGPTYTTDTARPTYTTNTADSANATDAADTTHTADTAYAAGDAVAIEAVEVVDINIATAPAATPAITAAPPRSHQHSCAEGERGACRVIAGRIVERRIWIHRWTVYSCGLIGRHVHNFRIGWLYHNHALVLNYSRFHCLLFSGLQSALVLRLPAHALNGIHQFALLRQEGIAEIGSPRNVVSQ
jgi:hypothetical protein